MVTINDKLSLIFDVDNLFDLNDMNVELIKYGDTYLIDSTYKEMIDIFRNNVSIKFIHEITNDVKSLNEWINWYGSDINDPMDIVIFLRYAAITLKLYRR